MSQDSQPDHTDELLGRMDALLGKHRPAEAAGDDDDIPVLTEVVIEIEEPGPDIPVLQDLAPEFDSATAFAEQDTFDIPVLEEALPDSLADLTAFSLEEGEPEVVLHIDSPPAREPELVLHEPVPAGLEITLELPLAADEAPVLLLDTPAPAAVRQSDIAAITDEILADVDAGLSARVESIVRRQFALTLAELYRTSLNDALQAALHEIRQDLRSTVEQVVAEQLSRREHD